MIVACAVVGLLMIITIYLNFFVAHKTIMNRYAYMFCIAVILGIVFANIFGQLCGKYTDAPENENFFPIFFMTEGTDLSSEAVTYKLNEGGITMLSFSVIFFAVMFVMIPL